MEIRATFHKSAQSLLCPTLYDPVVCSLPGSSIHGILQARILEWVAISFSRGPSQPGDRTRSPALEADALTSEPPGKPMNYSSDRFLCMVHMPVYTLCMKVSCVWTIHTIFFQKYDTDHEVESPCVTNIRTSPALRSSWGLHHPHSAHPPKPGPASLDPVLTWQPWHPFTSTARHEPWCDLIRNLLGTRRASLVTHMVKNLPAMWETQVRSLGWEDPLRRESLPTPVFWPGEFHGLYRPWGGKESDRTEQLSLSLMPYKLRKH